MEAKQEFGPERRRCLRQSMHAPAFASFDGVSGGMILDLSEEGLSMQTDSRLDRERSVRLELDLSEPAMHLETTGYIAWADALGRAGVRFADLPAEARERLNEWLTLNSGAPSHIAPKVSVGKMQGCGAEAKSAASQSAGSAGRVSGDPVSIDHAFVSLEAETESGETGGRVPASATVSPEPTTTAAQAAAAVMVSVRRSMIHPFGRVCGIAAPTGAGRRGGALLRW